MKNYSFKKIKFLLEYKILCYIFAPGNDKRVFLFGKCFKTKATNKNYLASYN